MTDIASITDINQIPADVATQFIDHLVRFRREHAGRIHIVKPSGSIIENSDLRRQFAKEVVRLSRDFGLQVAVVHGAGVQITAALKAAGKDSVFKDGLRVSHNDHMEIINRATLDVNETLCQEIDEAGEGYVFAKGMPGHHPDINMVSKPMDIDADNFSGTEVISMSTGSLKRALKDDALIPVITNVCQIDVPVNGVRYINVNADSVANTLATRLGAYRLMLCAEVPGVMEPLDGKTYNFKKIPRDELQQLIRAGNVRVLPEIRPEDLQPLLTRGVIDGGMVVKVKEAFATASKMGPGGAVVILDHNFSVETLTPRGAGTIFRAHTI